MAQNKQKAKSSGNLIDILSDVIKRKEISKENLRSAHWFRAKIKNFRRNLTVRLDDTSMTADQFMENSNLIKKQSIDEARLTLFSYKAKHAKTLPYYDRFPLSMILSQAPDGFIGLNFHYLPYHYRARLLDAVAYGNKINWQNLKRNKIVHPCIKKYLTSHVQGANGMTIEGTEQLKFAIFLPIEKFNTKKEEVWKDSIRML
jgi:hypothetical protein